MSSSGMSSSATGPSGDGAAASAGGTDPTAGPSSASSADRSSIIVDREFIRQQWAEYDAEIKDDPFLVVVWRLKNIPQKRSSRSRSRESMSPERRKVPAPHWKRGEQCRCLCKPCMPHNRTRCQLQHGHTTSHLCELHFGMEWRTRPPGPIHRTNLLKARGTAPPHEAVGWGDEPGANPWIRGGKWYLHDVSVLEQYRVRGMLSLR